MKTYKYNAKTSGIPWLLYAAVALVLLSIAGGLFYYAQNKSAHKNAAISAPTKEEAAAGTVQKEKLVKEQATDQGAKPGTGQNSGTVPQAANVVITDASQYSNPDGQKVVEVRAFVSNVIQADGSCTIVFTKDANTITKKVAANADAKTTQCTTVDVPRAEFPSAGSWSVTVTYASAKTTGEANTKVIVE